MHNWLRALLFLPFLLLLMFGAYSLQRWRLDQRRAAVDAKVGQLFPRLPLLDTAGQPFDPSFGAAAYTLVDCWFRDCPYCLAEMRQFNRLPGGDTLQILSISIDPLAEWQTVLRGSDTRWAFLQNQRSNWQHRVLDAKGGGENPAAQMLADSLGVTGYPAFFVVDRSGRIVGVPRSAADWQERGGEQAPWWQFLTDPEVWTPFRYALVLLLAFLLYRRILRSSTGL